jgi:ribosomal-protein-alanine N-acetyltransferase
MSTRSLFPRRVETERLRFEPLHESVDTLGLYDYHRSNDLTPVMRHLSQEVYDTPKQSMNKLETAAERWNEGTRAEYAIYPKSGEDGAGEFAGVASLMLEWEKRLCYFGLWLREPFWGRGYSGERAGVMLAVAFDRLDLDVVGAGYVPGNDQSKRAIEKYVDRYGGQYDGRLRNWIPGADGPRDIETYSILQEQWRDAVTREELATLAVER